MLTHAASSHADVEQLPHCPHALAQGLRQSFASDSHWLWQPVLEQAAMQVVSVAAHAAPQALAVSMQFAGHEATSAEVSRAESRVESADVSPPPPSPTTV